jgi:integrase
MTLLAYLEEPAFVARRRPNTLRIYRKSLRMLQASGVVDLADVTVARVQGHVDRRLGEVSSATVGLEVTSLLAVLSHLERTGRYEHETLRAMRRLRPPPPRREELSARFLTHEEVDRLCLMSFSDMAELTIRFAVLTGLRLGEAARVHWRDVDLKRRVLRVRGQTKTGRERVVPVTNELMDLLSGPLAAKSAARGGYLLSTTGRPADPSVLDKRVREAAKKAGLQASMNTLRHTRASVWASGGVPLPVLASWMGHSVEVCTRHYVGLTGGYDPRAELGAAQPRPTRAVKP